jgi:hypothetical protein
MKKARRDPLVGTHEVEKVKNSFSDKELAVFDVEDMQVVSPVPEKISTESCIVNSIQVPEHLGCYLTYKES